MSEDSGFHVPLTTGWRQAKAVFCLEAEVTVSPCVPQGHSWNSSPQSSNNTTSVPVLTQPCHLNTCLPPPPLNHHGAGRGRRGGVGGWEGEEGGGRGMGEVPLSHFKKDLPV